MDQEFTTRDEAARALASWFALKGIPAVPALTFATDLVGDICSVPPPPPDGLAALAGGWVIRDDDLKLLDAFISGAASGASAVVVVSGPTESMIVGLLSAACKLLVQVKRKSARVTPSQFRILRVLHDRPAGVEIDDLAKAVAATPESVVADLQRLREVHLGSGEIEAFVNVDSAGRWSARGV